MPDPTPAAPEGSPAPARPRVAVHNRFWHSRGGGERHGGMIAQVLSESCEVDLLSPAPLDLRELGSYLGLDLSRCQVRLVEDPEPDEPLISEISAEYDLFVNASHHSRLVSRARRSAYLCFFPARLPELTPFQKRAVTYLGPHLRQHAGTLTYGPGWSPPEGGRRRRWIWSHGEGEIILSPGPSRTLRFELGAPGRPDVTTLQLRCGEEVVASLQACSGFRRCEVVLPASTEETTLRFSSPTFNVPGDERDLGVAVWGMRLVGGSYGPRERLAYHFPWLVAPPNPAEFLTSYDVVLANSEFTRSWIQRLWGIDAEVCYPPIDTAQIHSAAPLETPEKRAILTIGRFFRPGLGHAKHQLEMVRSFAEAHRTGLLPGDVELWVVGGCEDSQRDYLREVEEAGEGAPVHVRTDVPRSELHRLLHEADVYWSATGLTADETTDPGAMEHFGMTTVEAMSAGCVPVVINRAGAREIVRPGVDGWRFETLQEAVARTRELFEDPCSASHLSAAAIARSEEFSEDAFALRVHALVERYDLLTPLIPAEEPTAADPTVSVPPASEPPASEPPAS